MVEILWSMAVAIFLGFKCKGYNSAVGQSLEDYVGTRLPSWYYFNSELYILFHRVATDNFMENESKSRLPLRRT